jgi:hypothetical protein
MTGPNVGQKRGWRHPGRQPSDFMQRAKDETRAFLKDKFKKELIKQVRLSMKKRR